MQFSVRFLLVYILIEKYTSFPFQFPGAPYPVHVFNHVQLQQVSRMIRPASCFFAPCLFKSQLLNIKRFHECFDYPYRIICIDKILKAGGHRRS